MIVRLVGTWAVFCSASWMARYIFSLKISSCGHLPCLATGWTERHLVRSTRSWLILATCLLGGCGRSQYDVAPVDGVVIIDGHPLTAARIMFAPIASGENRNSGKPAFGNLGSDGRFELTTYRDND